jgi:hypothetical protein
VRKKGNLHALIRSLSGSEKRYLRLHGFSGNDKANYLKLFAAVEKQDVADDESLKKIFKQEAFVKQLHVAKIYLSELILKSLRNYHSGNTITSSIHDLLRDAEILFRKELYESSLLKVRKALLLADKFEKLPLALECLQWERRVLLAMGRQGGDDATVTLEKEGVAISQLHQQYVYWHRTHFLFDLLKDDEAVTGLKNDEPATLQAKTLHKHLLYSYYFVNRQFQEAEEEISSLIAVLETESDRISDDPGSYVTAIGNKIGLLMSQKRWNEIEAMIRLMREVPVKYDLPRDSRFTVRLWLRIFNLELEVYRDTRQLEKGIQLSKDVKEYLTRHGPLIPPNYRIMLCFQSASIHFLKGNYTPSLHWSNEIVNENYGSTREDLQCYARILNLMIHYELGNILVIRYAVESFRRFFSKKKSLGEFEQNIFILFARLSKSPQQEHKKVFRYFRELLYPQDKQDTGAEDYLDFRKWMENKMQPSSGRR